MHPGDLLGRDSVVKSEYLVSNCENIVDNIFLNLMCGDEAENNIKCEQQRFLIHTDEVSSKMSAAENLYGIIKYKII